MRDVRIARRAGTQFNRLSRGQLHELGLSKDAIAHRVAHGRLVSVEPGVLAIPPVLDDPWGRWMGATLTAPGTFLSHVSAAAARGFWFPPRDFETVTRVGNGGPRRLGGILVFRSATLDGETEALRGVPITTVARTLLDLAAHLDGKALARAVRDAIRLGLTTVHGLVDYLRCRRGRRGIARLLAVLARYTDLPVHKARSGAEVHAMEHLRDAGFSLPRLNERVAGEEADLSWIEPRLILEIDGGPFHLDRGEDLRKQAVWESAGWPVRRVPSDDVYAGPERVVTIAAQANVPRSGL